MVFGGSMKKLVLLLFFPTAMFAAPKPATPPAIPDGLTAKFFKAQSQLVQEEAAVQQKRAAFQEAVSALQKACGSDFQIELGPQGDPVCTAKAEEKKDAPQK
jgi:hypothetical protein